MLCGWAIVVLAVKRLLARRWLALLTAVGLAAAVALIVSVPLYADAAYHRILHEELARGPLAREPLAPERHTAIQGPVPLKFLFRYRGAWQGALQCKPCAPSMPTSPDRRRPGLGSLPSRSCAALRQAALASLPIG
jgi:hypothetical protein